MKKGQKPKKFYGYETPVHRIDAELSNEADRFKQVASKKMDSFCHRQVDCYKDGVKIGSIYYDSFGDLVNAKRVESPKE